MHRILLTLATLAGISCLLASVCYSWFRVPVGLAITPAGYGNIGEAQPWITPYFQFGACAVVTFAILTYFLPASFRRIQIIGVTASFVLLLQYPLAISQSDPSILTRAASLQSQHDDLTWFGGDIFTSHEYQHLPSRMRIYASDTPRRIAVMQLPTWSTSEIGLHQLPNLVEWLGYTNAFCNFVGLGWRLAVLGGTMLVLATCFRNQRIRFYQVRVCVQTFILCGLGTSMAAWFWPLQSSWHLSKAAHHTYRGEYREAAEQLDVAGICWSPLYQDSAYVAQKALLHHRLGLDSNYAKFHAAGILEQQGLRDQSSHAYREIAESDPTAGGLQREACHGLLRIASRDLNSGVTTSVAGDLQRIVTLDPCNVKAMFALQLVHMRTRDQDALEQVSRQFIDTYRFLKFPNKKIVVAAAEKRLYSTRFENHEIVVSRSEHGDRSSPERPQNFGQQPVL